MKEIDEILYDHGLGCGRMISGSKKSPPGCKCVWNANVITKSRGKVWFGDLNLTKDGNALKTVAIEIGEPLYVLREMDCRFKTEAGPILNLIEVSVWNTDLPIP